MSFPRSLDEVSEYALHKELEERAAKRRNGLCDYCGRTPDTPPCKFPQRHNRTAPEDTLDAMWDALAHNAYRLEVSVLKIGASRTTIVSWNYGQGCHRLTASEGSLSTAVRSAYQRHLERTQG
jgi:hypothetical protein